MEQALEKYRTLKERESAAYERLRALIEHDGTLAKTVHPVIVAMIEARRRLKESSNRWNTRTLIRSLEGFHEDLMVLEHRLDCIQQHDELSPEERTFTV